LREGGRFVFSVEFASEDSTETGYRIQPHGRYCHAETHIQQRLRQAGLAPLRVLAATVREEYGEAVPGLVVTAVRASGQEAL
jgi:predicted TPR repeat methyltransferase